MSDQAANNSTLFRASSSPSTSKSTSAKLMSTPTSTSASLSTWKARNCDKHLDLLRMFSKHVTPHDPQSAPCWPFVGAWGLSGTQPRLGNSGSLRSPCGPGHSQSCAGTHRGRCLNPRKNWALPRGRLSQVTNALEKWGQANEMTWQMWKLKDYLANAGFLYADVSGPTGTSSIAGFSFVFF